MLSDNNKKCFRIQLYQMLYEIQTKGHGTPEKRNGSTIGPFDFSDKANKESEMLFSLKMQKRKEGLERKIEQALYRIDNDSYGICEECGAEISEKRLKARPVTTLCIECKRIQEEFESMIK